MGAILMSNIPLRLLSMGADGIVVGVEDTAYVLRLQLAGGPDRPAEPEPAKPPGGAEGLARQLALGPLDVQVVQLLLGGAAKQATIGKRLGMMDNGRPPQPVPKLRYYLCSLVDRGWLVQDDEGYHLSDAGKELADSLPQFQGVSAAASE